MSVLTGKRGVGVGVGIKVSEGCGVVSRGNNIDDDGNNAIGSWSEITRGLLVTRSSE